MDDNSIELKIIELRKQILAADRAYYVESNPVLSDREYDNLLETLAEMEAEYPEYSDINSPTKRVGSDIDGILPERSHSLPVLSLDKCYSKEELINWVKKTAEKFPGKIDLVIEPKIDGAGVVLYYNNGELEYCLTRGDGFTGNDITENIKTIGSVPLKTDYKGRFAVRGEVFIDKNDFKVLNEKYASNQYSNPRNLASGSVRRQKSKETALFPLKIFVYEGFFEENIFENHFDSLLFLKKNGFNVNSRIGYFSDKERSGDIKLYFKDGVNGKLDDIGSFIDNFTGQRGGLDYEIDGLVIKIDDLAVREELGFTRHHPRWAIAYKFDAPLAVTYVEDIIVQIGRAGRVTPVAILMPVELSGSVISRATLHNQDYINTLELGIGDKVSVSKRGDVIPAVEEVLEKKDGSGIFRMPHKCPSCGGELLLDGAHQFCVNENCPKRVLGTMQYFVSRGQMDIETLGDKTLEFLFEKGFVRSIPDIYEFDYNLLVGIDGFGEKKVFNIKDSVEKSKNKPFYKVLSSLGLKDIGDKASELLVARFKNVEVIINEASKNDLAVFNVINGIGDTLALSIIKHFTDPKVLTLVERLKNDGLQFTAEEFVSDEPLFLNGTKWVVTGSFESYKPRDKAEELIKKYGGEVSGSVSSKTTVVLCGKEPGSKFDKAVSLGIKIISEAEFIDIIKNKLLTI